MKSLFPLLYFEFLLIIGASAPVNLYAQQKGVISIDSVLNSVKQNLPKLQSYREQINARELQVKLSQNTLVPDFTAGYQAGYATDNNITGMSYPGLLLPISGPVSKNNSYQLVSGTALTALIKWNPFTFGQRPAV